MSAPEYLALCSASGTLILMRAEAGRENWFKSACSPRALNDR